MKVFLDEWETLAIVVPKSSYAVWLRFSAAWHDLWWVFLTELGGKPKRHRKTLRPL